MNTSPKRLNPFIKISVGFVFIFIGAIGPTVYNKIFNIDQRRAEEKRLKRIPRKRITSGNLRDGLDNTNNTR